MRIGDLGIALFVLAFAARPCDAQSSAGWDTYETGDSLVFRVPPDYERQKGRSRFDLKVSGSPGEFYIGASFSVFRVAIDSLAHWHFVDFPATARDGRFFDCAVYDSVTIDTVTIGGRRLVVERALLTGTLGHFERLPVVRVTVPLDARRSAILDGENMDAGANGRLSIEIAATIRSRHAKK